MLDIPFDQVEHCLISEYVEKLELSLNLFAGLRGGEFQIETLDNKQERAEREYVELKRKGVL